MDAQFEFSLIVSTLGLTKGTLIFLKKIGVIDPKKDNLKYSPIGDLKKGHLKHDLEYKRHLHLVEWGDTNVTSEMDEVTLEQGGIICLKTRNSIYQIEFE